MSYGAHVQVQDGPHVQSLQQVADDPLQGVDTAPVPHVFQIEPVQGSEHVGHMYVRILMQEQSHGQNQFLLNTTLIALTPEINLRTELDGAEDVGDGHLLHYPEAGFALDLLQSVEFPDQLSTYNVCVLLIGQFVVYSCTN